MMKYRILFMLFGIIMLTGCTASVSDTEKYSKSSDCTELLYAHEFTIEHYDDDISLVTIGGSDRYIIADENTEIPADFGNDTVIRRPVNNIYAAASSAIDLFYELDSLDSISMTSTKENDWSLSYMHEYMENGYIEFVGKYNAPDYEYILSENCRLALESTMIYHSPEIKEHLEMLGIPVMVERSSYETHPLGRLEWIKLYGELLGKQEQAKNFFDKKIALLNDITADEQTDKTAAFFYISTNGSVNVRKPGDYISKMIELAGGNYIFTADDLSIDENALSTMNIQMETFYSKAKYADFLIYNSTIEGEITSLEQLIEKNALFADFKAVKNGNVWCTGKNMFQQTTGTADMISDLHKIFTDKVSEKTQLTYIHHLD